jgi:hypothetical protein
LVLGECLRHRGAIGDIRPDERETRIVECAGEIEQTARVSQFVDDNNSEGRSREKVANKIRTDEPGAAGDEDGAGSSQLRPPGIAARA